MRWQGGEGGTVVGSEGREGGRVVRSEGGGFLVLFKGGKCRVTPIFHIFVSDVDHRKEKAGWFKDFLVWPQE